MATFVKYNIFVQDVGRGVHNLNTNSLRVALTNAAPTVSSNAVLADISQLVTGGGYTGGAGGGVAVTVTSYSQTSGVGTLAVTNDSVITASGGTIGPFRYAVLYNDTPTSPADPLIGYWDYGSTITLADGETFTVDFGASILTIT